MMVIPFNRMPMSKVPTITLRTPPRPPESPIAAENDDQDDIVSHRGIRRQAVFMLATAVAVISPAR